MSRKRKSISLKEKIEILKEFDKSAPGKSKADLAKLMGIPVSTLKTIIHDRQKIEEQASACGSSASKKMRMQEGKFPEMEKILLQFFNQCRASNIPISGPILMEKAKEIAIKLNLAECGFTAGWLQKFKARHGITCQVLSGESRDVPADSVAEWQKILPSIIQEYQPKDIFNADETGIFYHLMPNRTLAYKGEKCKGGEKSKDRLTVLLCVNCDGSEKITPLVVGKSKNPRCLKNIKTLPMDYDANKNAWMTTTIFTTWLKKLDNVMKRQKRKILLFIDRCTAHPQDTEFLENIKVIFFPSNCTSVLQPCDLGLIKNLKMHYRKQLVKLAIRSIEDPNPKKISVLHAMNMISLAWSQVTKTTIKNCFRKAGFSHQKSDDNDGGDVSDDDEKIPDDDWNLLKAETTFDEYINCDEDVITSAICSVDELIQNSQSEPHSDSDDEEECQEVVSPSFLDAANCIETLRTYFACHNTDEKTFRELDSLHKSLIRTQCQTSRQTTIDKFFCKHA